MKIKTLLDGDKRAPTPKQGTLSSPDSQPMMNMPIQIFQPWSNMIVKIKIPDKIFKVLLNVYDETMKDWKSFGDQLVGQVEEEPEVTEEIRNKFPEWINFCNSSVIEYIKTATLQTMTAEPDKMNEFMADKVLTRISTMWFVNQKPNEYNPIHIHTNCKVSAICYLKTPKQQIIGRKTHYKTDGKITFTNNTGTDTLFSNATCSFEPKAGDMYIFGALQHHMVWPYRSADPNDERVSISFNVDTITKSGLKRQQQEQEEMVKYYQEQKQKSENEKLNLNNEVKDDKSADASNINKSG